MVDKQNSTEGTQNFNLSYGTEQNIFYNIKDPVFLKYHTRNLVYL